MPKDDEVYQKRDLILTEIHSDVRYLREKVDTNHKYLNERLDDQKTALDIHQKKDEMIQGWILKIGIVVLVVVIANGGMPAIKALFNIQ